MPQKPYLDTKVPAVWSWSKLRADEILQWRFAEHKFVEFAGSFEKNAIQNEETRVVRARRRGSHGPSERGSSECYNKDCE